MEGWRPMYAKPQEKETRGYGNKTRQLVHNQKNMCAYSSKPSTTTGELVNHAPHDSCYSDDTGYYFYRTRTRTREGHTLQPLQPNSPKNPTTWANHRFAIHDIRQKRFHGGRGRGTSTQQNPEHKIKQAVLIVRKQQTYLEIVKRGREESNDVQHHDSQQHVPVPPAPVRPRVQE